MSEDFFCAFKVFRYSILLPRPSGTLSKTEGEFLILAYLSALFMDNLFLY